MSIRPIVIALLLTLLPATTRAAGRWTVFIKPSGWNDAIAGPDTVWMASTDAGLWRYRRSTGEFASTFRAPSGLGSNHLTTLARDRSGRLWVGTLDAGVSVLASDGENWTVLNAFDGLPSAKITCLEVSGDSVWIGTDAGLSLWNGREISGTIPDGINPSPFASDEIRGISVLGDDVLVGTAQGIYRARLSQSLANWTATNTGLTGMSIDGMASDGRDVFALAATATHRWNATTGDWGVAGGNGNAVRIREDFGRIATVAPQGMFVWQAGPAAWAQVAGAPVSGFSVPGSLEPTVSSDSLVIALDPSGLRLASDGFAPRLPPAPSGNDINNVVAHDGTAYVGTQGTGLSRYRDGVWRTWGASESCGSCTSPGDTSFINTGYVLGLYQDLDHVNWVGCWGASLSRMDDRGPTPAIWNRVVNDTAGADPVLHTFTWSGTRGPNDTRWFGLDTGSAGVLIPNGIDVFLADGTYVRSYPPGYGELQSGQIRALDYDRRGRMWLGYAARGVAYIDDIPSNYPASDQLTITNMPNTVTLNIFAIRSVGDVLWVLAEDGLRRLSITSTTLSSGVPYSANAGAMAPRGAVHPLEVTPDGSVWVGTSAGLRHYLNPTATTGGIGAFEDFTISNSPLPSNEVRSVYYDSTASALWIATETGVARFEPDYVPPAPPVVAHLAIQVYPNPVTMTGIGFALRVRTDRPLDAATILDLGGRVVRHLRGVDPGAVIWDGRDQKGEHVHPGVYFLRAVTGGVEGVARLVVVR